MHLFVGPYYVLLAKYEFSMDPANGWIDSGSLMK